MTKEELEKEAEEWAKDHHYYNGTTKGYVAERDNVINSYLACAEPREKQIRALQKQNGELTDKVKELEEKLKKETAQRIYNFNKSIEWKERHRELEAQLNKLKPYRCKNHYAVSETETSNAVICYRVQNCESCGHFKE